MHFVVLYTTSMDPTHALQAASEFLTARGFKRKSDAVPFCRGSHRFKVFDWFPARRYTEAWLLTGAAPLIGCTLRLEMEVENKHHPLSDDDKVYWEDELEDLGHALNTEDYRGSCSPWPFSVFLTRMVYLLGGLGIILGGVAALALNMPIPLIFMVALAGMIALMYLGIGLERKRQKAIDAKNKIHDNYGVKEELNLPAKEEETILEPARLKDNEVVKLETEMNREIRRWAIVTGVLGVANIAGSQMQSAWGFTLVVVALLSILFPAPVMFILYGVTLIWVALSNITSGSWIFFGFAVLQVVAGVQVLKKYSKYAPIWQYYHVNLKYPGMPQPEKGMLRAYDSFATLGVLLGILGAVGSFLLFAFAFVQGSTFAQGSYGHFKSLALDFAIDMGMLGFATGLASLLAKYKHTILSILTMIATSVVILLWVGFLVLSLLYHSSNGVETGRLFLSLAI
jgi:hypothetical protein